MKNVLIFSVLIGTLSSAALAQRHNGMGHLMEFDYDSSYRWSKFNCSDYRRIEYRGNHSRSRLNCRSKFETTEEIQACQIAKRAVIKAAAYRVADKATRDGVIAGYHCGVDKGIDAGNNYRNKRDGRENFPRSFEEEILNDKYGTLKRYTKEPAERAAIGQAENDVVSRFRAAVREEGGNLPSSVVSQPRLSFNGVENGYNKNGHSVPSIESILQATYDNEFIDLDIYFSHDYGFNDWRGNDRRFRRSRRGMRINRGIPTNRDASRTWRKIVDTRKRYLPRPLVRLVRKYQELSGEKITKVITERFQPAALADGTIPPMETREKTIVTKSPRGIFKDTFARLWDSSLTTAYNRIVERNLDNGFQEGFPVGQEVGAKYAIELGTQEEYNKLYRAESIKRYGITFQSTYEFEFTNNYETMASSSVLENLHWDIIENDADGALLQGERISFEFGLTNIGGIGKRIGVNAGVNDIENTSRSAMGYDAMALSEKSFKTDAFVILPENEIAIDQKQTNIRVSFSAGGLNGSKVVTIFKPVGFEHGSPKANLQTSELIIPITISNPRVETRESVVVSMFMNGQAMEQKFESLPSGTQTLYFKVKKDFFEMLGKTFNFKVELSHIGEVIQSRENLSVTIDKKSGLIEYFDYLVLNRNAVLPSSFEEQFKKYRAAVKEVATSEITPMIEEFNSLESGGFLSRNRSNISKKYKELYKLSRSDRSSVHDPSILTQLYLKRVGNRNKKELKRLDKKVKAAYKSLASDGLVMVYNLMTSVASSKNQRYYRSGVCHLAQQLVSIFDSKRRSEYGDSASYKLSKKKKFSCEY